MMELPAYLRTTLLRQRWLVAAERFERALVDLEPDYPPEKKQALEQRLALRQEALARAYIALDRLNLRFDPNQPRIPAGAPGAGQAVDQPVRPIGLKVAPDLVELLAGISYHLAGPADIRKFLRKFQKRKLAAIQLDVSRRRSRIAFRAIR